MTTTQRIDLETLSRAPIAAALRLEQAIDLDPGIRHLVKVRGSMVNGCAYCLDMHWTAARAEGEPEARLAQLATWEESPYYDERERAALALTDAMTHVSETHVPDDVWRRAEAHFEAGELAHLVWAIGAINLWNRVVITARPVAASSEAAQAAQHEEAA